LSERDFDAYAFITASDALDYWARWACGIGTVLRLRNEIRRSILKGGKDTSKVVVATTVMLSFISFWRAAVVVSIPCFHQSHYSPAPLPPPIIGTTCSS
jgi:hypothetical protein